MVSSSYQALADFLASKKGDVWEASFGEVEEKLGRPLPRSAYRHQAWWANQTGPGHSQTRGWRSAGWRTAKLDLERQRVRFERETPPAQGGGPRSGEVPMPEAIDEELVERAMKVSDISSRETVINAALKAFIQSELVRFVEELGGSQPGFQAAPRERPWA